MGATNGRAWNGSDARAVDPRFYGDNYGTISTDKPHTSPSGSSWNFFDIFGKGSTSNAGGLGDFGTYTAADGSTVNLNEDAYNAIKGSGYDGELTKNGGFFGADGFGMGDALGLGKLGVGLGNLYLADQQLGLAKDTFNFNKADRNRTYEANRKKYNNAVARTNAVNAHYGVGNTSSLI